MGRNTPWSVLPVCHYPSASRSGTNNMRHAEDGEGGGGNGGDKISKSEKDQVGWLSVMSWLRFKQTFQLKKKKSEKKWLRTVGSRDESCGWQLIWVTVTSDGGSDCTESTHENGRAAVQVCSETTCLCEHSSCGPTSKLTILVSARADSAAHLSNRVEVKLVRLRKWHIQHETIYNSCMYSKPCT